MQVRASPKLVRKFFTLGCLVSLCTTFPILLPQNWIRKCLISFKNVFNSRYHSKHHSLCKILTTKWFCSGQICLKLTCELRLLFFFVQPFSCLSVKHKLPQRETTDKPGSTIYGCLGWLCSGSLSQHWWARLPKNKAAFVDLTGMDASAGERREESNESAPISLSNLSSPAPISTRSLPLCILILVPWTKKERKKRCASSKSHFQMYRAWLAPRSYAFHTLKAVFCKVLRRCLFFCSFCFNSGIFWSINRWVGSLSFSVNKLNC